MAELSARIIAKASGTASEEPLAADLEVAELAVNTADGKLFTKHTDGSVVTISGGGGVEEAPQDNSYYVRQNAAWTSLFEAQSALEDRTVDGGNFITGSSDGDADVVDGGNFS